MISSTPYYSIALNAYGYSLLLQNKKLSYAEELIRRAINIDPGNAAILDSLAWALYLDGSYKDAYEYASLAYTKDQDPEIVTHYYKILMKNGYKKKARDILEESLINNPKNTELLELMDDITMKQLTCKSFAKVNLCLHVLDKRDDGFHNIQSIFQTINFFDTLKFVVTENSSITLECNCADLNNNDNIIIKTWHILANKFNIKKGIHISLIKNVPLGSGLGGGSSNAAVTLLAINKLFNLQLSSYEFQSIAESLGSTCLFLGGWICLCVWKREYNR